MVLASILGSGFLATDKAGRGHFQGLGDWVCHKLELQVEVSAEVAIIVTFLLGGKYRTAGHLVVSRLYCNCHCVLGGDKCLEEQPEKSVDQWTTMDQLSYFHLGTAFHS